MPFSPVRDIGRTVPSVLCEWITQMIDAVYLPIVLPEVKYLPTEDGLPPLGNAEVWAWDTATKSGKHRFSRSVFL
jgi:leucyl-tRNA synthetase